MAKKIYI